MPASAANAATDNAGMLPFYRIEAVKAQALDAQAGTALEQDRPPATGWVDVTLPDMWSTRWPGFDGVVWYRLSWRQPRADTPLAFALDYLNMAGAIYLNGTLLMRDGHLAEPLSRAWNTPRYLLLPGALLREGSNTLLVRVSGMAGYQGGLGAAVVGDPARIRARFENARWLRNRMQLFSLAISATLGCLFLSVWLMYREKSVYGWFALMSLAWWICGYNQVATSPWPFASTDGWEIANTIALLLYSVSFTIFILRFCERRWPRYEFALWSALVLASAALLFTPHAHIAQMRAILSSVQAIHYFATCFVFLVYAWRSRRPELRILGCCAAVFVAAGVHDLLSFLGLLHDNLYFAALTAQVLMVGMALMLGRQFVENLRRIERFNHELTQSVEAARHDLARTLHRQHDLEITNARLGERLKFAHELHDGLGGTLFSSIVTLERAPLDVPPHRFLAILRELRDDLRFIIDSSRGEQYGEISLAEQIAPLRHRLTRLFEAQGIEWNWQQSGIDAFLLPSTQSLDVTRILQEALTNVFKHSGASHVDVDIHRDADGLRLTVHDNGVGFTLDADGSHTGTGMQSMRARAGRLGGRFDVRSSPGSTLVTLDIPLAEKGKGKGKRSTSA